MFFPFHGQSKACCTMVNPPPFGLPMAHPPWSGADCYQWSDCYGFVGYGVVGAGIGHTHHRHGSPPPPSPGFDTYPTLELVCSHPSPPPKPPWPPPCHNSAASTTTTPIQPVSPVAPPTTVSMSGRQKKKQASVATGARLPSSSYSEEFPPLTHQTSPRRKGKGRKRLGPSSPPHKNPPPNASAASKNPSAAAYKSNTSSKTSAAASSNFEEEPLHGRALDYNAPPFVLTGSANPSFDTAAAARRRSEFYKAATEVVSESWEQASLDERSSNGDGFSSPPRRSTAASAAAQKPSVQFDSPSNQYYDLGPSFDSSSSSEGSFVDDWKPASKPDFEDDRKPAAKPVLEDDCKPAAQSGASRSAPCAPNGQSPSPPSDGSHSSGGSSSVDAGAYNDLIRFGRKIRWRTDDNGVKWPEYSSLSVKELKEVLSGRALSTSGKKDLLIRRLENKDKRTWVYHQSLAAANLRPRREQDQVPNRFKSNLDSFIGNVDASRSRSDSFTSVASEVGSPRSKKSAAPPPRAKSLPPPGVRSNKTIEVDVESASDSETSQMSVDSDAVEMFPKVSAEEKEERRRDSRLMQTHKRLWGAHLNSANSSRKAPAVSTSGQPTEQSPPAVDTSASAKASSTGQPSVSRTASASAASPEEVMPSSSGRSIPPARGSTTVVTEEPDGSYVAALKKTPPDTIATASTAQSSVSSLRTPSGESASGQTQGSGISSVTGKLLNTRPRRNVQLDGVANYVAITIHPSRSARVIPPPPEWVYEGLLAAFTAFHRIDPSVKWYPKYDPEPGEDPIAPIDDPSNFPAALCELQLSHCNIDNPWDLRVVASGEIDPKTNRQRTYKSIYTTVLMGSKYELDHILQLAVPSLANHNVQSKRKEVDALKSKTLYALVGVPLDFDSLAICRRLTANLGKHEEWMQGNVTYGYNAREYCGEVLPPMVVCNKPPRMPESKDILPSKDIEAIQYMKTLRTMQHIEVSTNDQARFRGLLLDFRARGKLNCITLDADLLECVNSNNMEQSERLEFFRCLKAQMQYAHNHRCVTFANVDFLMYPFRVELEDPSQPHFKKSHLKREILDFRRPGDNKKVFVGVMECTGEKEGSISLCYYNDDANESFIKGMGPHLAAYTYQYLKNHKCYTVRCINSALSAFSPTSRLSASDSIWNAENRSIRLVGSTTTTSFAARMEEREATFDLSALMVASRATTSQFSDEAKERVAALHNLRRRPGYNPTPAGDASAISNTSHTTNGAASNRSVTSENIQCHMPELRLELSSLKQELLERSPEDPLFNEPVMIDSNVDNLSLSSSASSELKALYKDTKACILLLKLRLAELRHGVPPPSSGSAGQPPSNRGGVGPASAQGG